MGLRKTSVCGDGNLGRSNAKLCSGDEKPIYWVRQKENIQPLTKSRSVKALDDQTDEDQEFGERCNLLPS